MKPMNRTQIPLSDFHVEYSLIYKNSLARYHHPEQPGRDLVIIAKPVGDFLKIDPEKLAELRFPADKNEVRNKMKSLMNAHTSMNYELTFDLDQHIHERSNCYIIDLTGEDYAFQHRVREAMIDDWYNYVSITFQ